MIYVKTTGNDTAGDGSYALPFRTIQKAISVGSDINVGGGLFTEDLNTDLAINDSSRVICATNTEIVIVTAIGSKKIYFNQGNIDIQGCNLSENCVLFDKSIVQVNTSLYNFQCFFHCDITINTDIQNLIAINCEVNFYSKYHWLRMETQLFYFCNVHVPGELQYYNIRIPFYDFVSLKDLVGDIYPSKYIDNKGYAVYDSVEGNPNSVRINTRVSTEEETSLTVPFSSINNIPYGVDLTANNDYHFLLSSLVVFVEYISKGNYIGVFQPSNLNHVYDMPNFIESYISMLYDESFITDKEELYLKGILNKKEMIDGLSYLYSQAGVDVRNIIKDSSSHKWDYAGDRKTILTLLKTINDNSGFYELNKKYTSKIGCMPFRYNETTQEIVFFQEWNSADLVYQYQRIIKNGFIFEATESGFETGSVEPTWDYTKDAFTIDNNVRWKCLGAYSQFETIYDSFERNGTRFRVRNQSDNYSISITDGHKYIFFDINTKSYHVLDITDDEVITTNIAMDLKQGTKIPIALLFIDSGIMETFLPLIGGWISFNNIYSYETKSRGYELFVDNTNAANDNIISQINSISYAIDTILFKRSKHIIRMPEMLITRGTIIKEGQYYYIAKNNGETGVVFVPSGIGVTTMDGSVEWHNIGHFGIFNKQMEQK